MKPFSPSPQLPNGKRLCINLGVTTSRAPSIARLVARFGLPTMAKLVRHDNDNQFKAISNPPFLTFVLPVLVRAIRHGITGRSDAHKARSPASVPAITAPAISNVDSHPGNSGRSHKPDNVANDLVWNVGLVSKPHVKTPPPILARLERSLVSWRASFQFVRGLLLSVLSRRDETPREPTLFSTISITVFGLCSCYQFILFENRVSRITRVFPLSLTSLPSRKKVETFS